MIAIEGLVKEFTSGATRVRAVDDVSLQVKKGAFFTLLGPSGCGKTTTLRCVAGLERPTGGRILLDDALVASASSSIPAHKRDIGMVFQSYAVWPHLSVFENVAFPLRVGKRRYSKVDIESRVEDALTLVGLGGLGGRMATQLSGGQQQRLSLARAVVREPACLLLDEPLSNLDAKLRDRMRGELALIQRRLGITALYVTHDQLEALAMSDEIAVMDRGRVVQRGTPWEIYYEPRTEFVARFIGSTNLYPGRISTIVDGVQVVETDLGQLRCDPGSANSGDSVLVGIRPEEVQLSVTGPGEQPAANRFPGTIVLRQFGGGTTDFDVRTESGGMVRVRMGSRTGIDEGDSVVVEVPSSACRIIPEIPQPH